MSIPVRFLILILGFVLLVKGADWFVEGASKIAKRLGVSQLIIGLTIVAMGTSLPEAAISITAALKGSMGIAVGNVLGSNNLNVLLILGLTATIMPIVVDRSVTSVEIPLLLGVSILLPLLGLTDQVLGRLDGTILFVIFVLYMAYLLCQARGNKQQADRPTEQPETAEKPMNILLTAAMIVVGAACIVLGSNLSVDSATAIAKHFGMSDRLIGLTIVAIGTSLPELVTSVTAALKGRTEIAIGNVVGSNLFNVLFVLSISAMITPLPYSMDFLGDSIVFTATSVLLMLLVVFDKKLQRSNGAVMLAAFAGYYVWLFLKA